MFSVLFALNALRTYLTYEQLIVYNDHTASNWLLTINDASGRLIRWPLHLIEFDFDVKYKKCSADTQADALSRLNLMSETISHDHNDDITVVNVEIVSVEFELNRRNDDTNFIDVQYDEVDVIYISMDFPASNLLPSKRYL